MMFVWLQKQAPSTANFADDLHTPQDIAYGHAFRWSQFLAGRPWDAQLLPTVKKCRGVCIKVDGRSGLLLETSDNKRVLVHVNFERTRAGQLRAAESQGPCRIAGRLRGVR